MVGIGETRLMPDSLWIPIPTSISSSLSRCFCSSSSSDSDSWCLLPGIVQWSSDAPMVTRLATTASPSWYTSLNEALFESLAALAPTILCTRLVPAKPRLPTIPFLVLPTETSSWTISSSTGTPSALARSAASPKCRMSPV
ncbi:hypothetical protein OGATHE_000216 [Ogataea polymorpha]|uniref:Uncharacterized protein n=1 Tax=Ogataea polymorpha TaxID=460523 RepID=A0A9P8THK0_9ASCO|nr:hypothetical protein OGATHE_000216 [Ogataea polymorpha]